MRMFLLILTLIFTSSLYAAPGPTRVAFTKVRNVYSSTNVTTSAWVQLVAVTANPTTSLEIFDSSGQTLQLGVGASGSEVGQLYIYPGGNGVILEGIAKGSRVSIKAVSGTANSGEIDINFYQ